MNQDKIGKFIYELRIKNNYTQKELANMLSVTSQAISKWENGRGIPDIEQLKKLSEIFNISLNELLEGKLEEKKVVKEKVSNKKKYIITLSIILLVLTCFLFKDNSDKSSFSFSRINTDNSCFLVKGVIAFNKNKKSIYISNIECSDNNSELYLDMECILYEKDNNIEKSIYTYGNIKEIDSYDKNNGHTINELLKDIEFNIDNYDCSCDNNTCDNLYLRVNALNTEGKVITYNIPLMLENKCINN